MPNRTDMKPVFVILLAILLLAGVFIYVRPQSHPNVALPKHPAISKDDVPADRQGPIVGSRMSGGDEYLTDAKGMTLYVFANDGELKSNCDAVCLKTWPLYEYNNKELSVLTDDLSWRMSIFKKSNGYEQYAYMKRPVYYFSGDKAPGDTKGNGLGYGRWSIILINKQ